MLDIIETHECNDCGDSIIKKCYCEDCKLRTESDAFEAGKKEGENEGYDKGYEKAKEELSNTPSVS